MFPKEYKRALQEAEAEAKLVELQSQKQQGEEQAPDVVEGEEGYIEDIMQDTPAKTMQQVINIILFFSKNWLKMRFREFFCLIYRMFLYFILLIFELC